MTAGAPDDADARLEALYRAAAEGRGADPRSLRVRSLLARRNGRTREAAALAAKWVSLEPGDAAAQRLLARLCAEAGWREAAAAAFARAILIDPWDAASWRGLGEVHRGMGRARDARFCLAQAARLDPPEAGPAAPVAARPGAG